MMEASYHHHYPQDLQQVNFNNTNSASEGSSIPVTYYNSQYLHINQNNYSYPYNQSTNYNPVAGQAAVSLAADYYIPEYPNSYPPPPSINNHDNHNRSSSSLNTPTLDQTSVSSYYPTFQAQQQSSTAAAIYHTPDYYFPAQSAGSTGVAPYNQAGGGSPHEPVAQNGLFASTGSYNSPANYQQQQQHPQVSQQQQRHGSATTERVLAMDRAQAKATAFHRPTPSATPGHHHPARSASRPIEAPRAREAPSQSIAQQSNNNQGSAQHQNHCLQHPNRNSRDVVPLSLKLNAQARPHAAAGPLDTAHRAAHKSDRPSVVDNIALAAVHSAPTADRLLRADQGGRGEGGAGETTTSRGLRPKMTTATAKQLQQQSLKAAAVAASRLGPMISRRKNATRETTATLKDWLDEHGQNPYPTKGEKIMLSILTKMSLTQVSTWFANARRRMKKENRLFWGGAGKQAGGGTNLQAPSGDPNRRAGGGGPRAPPSAGGTTSIRYFIHKHQKHLSGASSMLALAGHQIQGRPFVFCPHSHLGNLKAAAESESHMDEASSQLTKPPVRSLPGAKTSGAAEPAAAELAPANNRGDSGPNSSTSSCSPLTTTADSHASGGSAAVKHHEGF